jgi:hypothetical protein
MMRPPVMDGEDGYKYTVAGIVASRHAVVVLISGPTTFRRQMLYMPITGRLQRPRGCTDYLEMSSARREGHRT